jgi:hypothetical protein
MTTTIDQVPRDSGGDGRVRRLYDMAVELKESEWEPFLIRECPEDPETCAEVLRILKGARRARAEEFLDQPVEIAPPTDPKQIGKYQVVRRLSAERTGQGTAYFVFDPDTDRHVVIKRYHDGDSLATAEEGRTLARVTSPYVARCYMRADPPRHQTSERHPAR